MTTSYITGQILVRDKGEKEGRTLYMIVGIIAVPEHQKLRDGHQYTVVGDAWGNLRLDAEPPIDRHQETIGYDANRMLTSPLWRV